MMRWRDRIFALALAAGLGWGMAALPAEEEPLDVTPEAIAEWIEELDSGSFAVREAATANLQRGGTLAVGPLTLAADGDRPEVTRRAIRVLQELCQSADAATVESARDALGRLAGSKRRTVAHRAAAALRMQRRVAQRRAIQMIEKLGGTVYAADLEDGELFVSSVLLGKNWTGGNDGLAHVKELGGLEYLGLYGPQFTDDALVHLGELAALESLQAYATQISDAGEEALREALPHTKLDRRRGGLLGISGAAHEKGCKIELVQAGTAADGAGLQPDDVITKVDGQAVKDFAGLTAAIARKKAGDTAEVEFLRGQRATTVSVVLGELPLPE